LLERGFIYPKSPGEVNHIGLTAYSRDQEHIDMIRRRCGVSQSKAVPGYRSKLRRSMRQEIDRSGASAILLSNEHLSARVRETGEIERLKKLCDSLAGQTTVIVYLRNQIDYLVSWYNTLVKAGNSKSFDTFGPRRLERQVDYARMLAPWCEIFGHHNLIVRRYEQQDFRGGDVISDFASVVGLETKGLAPLERLNESLDAEGMEFLRQFNLYLPRVRGEGANPERAGLARILLANKQGEGFRVSAKKATEIEDRFRKSNREVSKRYFGSRFEPLFPPSRSVKWDGDVVETLSVEACIRISVLLWRDRRQKVRQGAVQTDRSNGYSGEEFDMLEDSPI
jgi:hypothetical protein